MAASAAKTLAFVLLVALSCASAAQQRHKRGHPVEQPAGVREAARLINSDEGLAIIGAALEVRYRTHPREDCSHLVHDIYRQAGFRYRYADSSELYSGIDAFRQVTRPQPGDLAVWKGHAAIVINPAQHTFFSSTRRGLRVESYDLKYWKRRGTPRFFRYVTLAPSTLPTITRTAGSSAATLEDADSHSERLDRSPDQDSGSDTRPQ